MKCQQNMKQIQKNKKKRVKGQKNSISEKNKQTNEVLELERRVAVLPEGATE